jgi:hypothetical protein
MIEVLKQALEALEDVGVLTNREWQAVHKNKANDLRQAIAEWESQSTEENSIIEDVPAIGGLQRTEQEPVAWLLTEKNINSLQVDSIQLLIDRLKHAHHTDLCVRINGQDEWFQADWLKHMVRATPPQRTEQEPRNVRERWNVELDGNDLLICFNDHEKGDKCQYERYSPQRTWVGLTKEQLATTDWSADFRAGALWAEAKLKQKNGYAEEKNT